MPQSIPAGLTKDHILRALTDIDAGIDHPFGQPTGYELVHEDKRYAPKAVIGLACQYSVGRILQPNEFSGGEAPGQANFVLRDLSFTIERKADTSNDEDDSLIQEERQRRYEMWESLKQRGGPKAVASSVLRDLGIYGGAQGIWMDKSRTSRITSYGEGITVAVLHTGSSYADDIAEDCIIYHYPQTRRSAGRDLSEVNATKKAGSSRLPFFVVTYPTPSSTVRDVQLGWVESWDDELRTFLITFGDDPPSIADVDDLDDTLFELSTEEKRGRREAKVRTGQQRFKFWVLQRYGPKYAVCGLDELKLLDAAHIRPKHADGSDDPRNGMVLCANYHRAFDAGLFRIDPSTLEIRYRNNGPNSEDLRMSFPSISHLRKQPHTEALSWLWNTWDEGAS